MNDKPLTVEVNGRPWHLYLFEWTGADGKFGGSFYAISDEHAQLVMQDIKETGVVLGRSGGTIPMREDA